MSTEILPNTVVFRYNYVRHCLFNNFIVLDFQAKTEYERAERRREKKKASGEDTWMLPSLNKRIGEDVSNVGSL